MNRHWPLVQVLRLCLETQNAVSISAGAHDGSDDLRLALAPNGLPCLPASGLAGALRSELRARRPEVVDELFGWVRGQQGAASRLQIDAGVMHDSHDLPVRGWPMPGAADPLLDPWLQQPPPLRRRNAGGHRGATLIGAHFDRPFVPAGTRFSVDLRLWGHDAAQWQAQADLLGAVLLHAGLRLGGATRSGMGRVQALTGPAWRQRGFDLRQRRDLQDYLAWMREGDPRQLHSPAAPATAPPAAHWGECTLQAVSDGPIRVGGGSHSLKRGADEAPDDMPQVEQRAHWAPQAGGQRGRLQWCVVIPFSAVKGALAHRVAFHDLRLRNAWATAQTAAPADVRAASPAVLAWFGRAAGRGDGHAGALRGDDLAIPAEQAAQHLGRAHRHQSDRFTAAPMPHLLFQAESLYHLPLQWRIEVDFARAQAHGADATALQALDLALDDLAQGRLGLGADQAIGLGFLQPGARLHKHGWQLPPAMPAAGEPEPAK